MINFLKKLRRKWTYSIIGIWTAFKEEKSLWMFLFVFLILILVGILIKLDRNEWSIITLIMFLLLSIEILNTALEAAVDTISFQYNIKIKKIKDISSGAIFTISLGSTISVLIIYIPKIMEMI